MEDKKKLKKVDYNKIIKIIIILGIIIRFIYGCYTDYNVRQHDIEEDYGHIAYIEYIVNNGSLPDSNIWQFYHPPFHHIVSAIWMKILTYSFFNDFQIHQALKFLPFLYSILILILSKKILEEIGIKDEYISLVMLVMAFHPAYIYSSVWLNNDTLTCLLTFAIIFYLIKWAKNIHVLFDENSKNYKEILKNTIIMAVLMGLCVMTKLNGALIALPIAVIFIYNFIKYLKNKNLKYYIGILAIFGIISLSIGLWYPIRNYIKFNQELTYVPKPGESMNIGEYSFKDRFLSIPMDELFGEVFCDQQKDYNLISFIIKSSIYGEYDFFDEEIASVLKIFNIILIAIVLVSVFRNLIPNREDSKFRLCKNILLLIYFTNICSFLYFNIKMPYSCTMHFRYIITTLYTSLALFAVDLERLENKKYFDKFLLVVYILIVTFCSLSAEMFLVA